MGHLYLSAKMKADELSPSVWNAIADGLERARNGGRQVTFGKVVKRDTRHKLIWLEAYGNLAIPLAAFAFGFAYYDTDNTGHVIRREDTTDKNTNFQTHIIVPHAGQTAVVLDPGGLKRFPICVGVIQSTNFWQGEDF